MAVVTQSGDECLHAVRRSIELYNRGRVKESKRQLQFVARQAGVLIQESGIKSSLLEGLQTFALGQQAKIAKKMDRLLNEERELCNRSDKLAETLQLEDAELSILSDSIRDAERKQKRHEREREEAARKVEEMNKWWWVPLYGQVLAVRELIEDNAAAEEAASRRIAEYAEKKRTIQNSISYTRTRIVSIRQRKAAAASSIRRVKLELDEMHTKLSQLRIQTDNLMQATNLIKEVMAAAVEGDARCSFLQKIVNMAHGSNNAGVLTTRGSQTHVRSFVEAWDLVKDLIMESRRYNITFQFVCSSCNRECNCFPRSSADGDLENFICETCHAYYQKQQEAQLAVYRSRRRLRLQLCSVS